MRCFVVWVWILVGLPLLAAVAWAASRFQFARAETRRPPKGDTITVDGVRTHLIDRGEGPALVFLHGLNGYVSDFTGPILEDLVPGHRVLVIDRPGYGHSERPRRELADPVQQAAWLETLLEQRGIEEAILVGHSLGGGISLALANAHPDRVRGLVLLAPYVYPYTDPDDWIHRLPRVGWLRRLVENVFLVPIGTLLSGSIVRASFEPETPPEGYIEEWRDMSLRPEHFETMLDEARSVDPALARLSASYPEITIPAEIVTGDGDRSVDRYKNAHRLEEALPHAQLTVLEGTGHMLSWTQPEEVLAAIDRLETRLVKR